MEYARATLQRIRHLEALEDPWSPDRRYRQWGDGCYEAFLGARSPRCLRALHGKELLAALRRLESCPADDPDALALKGRIGWLLGREEGQAHLERALALKPAHPEALGYLGTARAARDPKGAVGILELASRKAPEWPWPFLWSAAARLQVPGQSDLAVADVQRFLDLGGTPALGRMFRALTFLSLRRAAEAARDAEALIALEPHGCAGYALRSRARLELGDRSGALADHSEAKDRDPDLRFADLNSLGVRSRAASRADPSGLLEHIAQLDEALAAYPDVAFLHVERAEILREPCFNRFDMALESYARAEALEPERAWLQAHLARAEAQTAGVQKSLERLDRAVSLYPEGGWIYAWRGETKRRLGRLEDALEDFEAAGRMPWYGYTHAWKGATLVALERWPEALESLDCAVTLETTYPTNALAFHTRSLARRGMGDMAGAVEDLTQAFRLDPKYAWVGMGTRPEPEEAFRKGIAELDRAVAQRPDLAWSHAWRGYTRLQARDLAGAREDLTRAIALDPGNAWAHAWRGLVGREQGERLQTLADLENAMRIEPLGLAAALLAESYSADGRLEEALELMRRSEEGSATSASFFFQKGEIQLRLGRLQEALADLRRAVQLDKRYADAHALMARAHLELGDAASAVEEAEAALRLKPGLPVAHLARGLARGRLGDPAGQLEDLKKVYGLDSGLFAGADPALLELLKA